MAKPNLFIAGAPKCGTTAMYEYLKTHPQIYMSPVKEPCFFADDFAYRQLSRSMSDYLQLFQEAGENHCYIGEASPLYLRSRMAIENINRYAPESRLVIMLRNPVDLLPSFHAERRFHYSENEPDFETAWRKEEQGYLHPRFKGYGPNRYRDVVDFPTQIERVYKYFPEEQVHIIIFDDFARDTALEYSRLLEFLQLDHDGRQTFPRVNENKDWKNQTLGYLLERPPQGLRKMAALYKMRTGASEVPFKRRAFSQNQTKTARQPLSSVFRQELTDHFSADIDRLSRLIKRDLSHWKTPAGKAGKAIEKA